MYTEKRSRMTAMLTFPHVCDMNAILNATVNVNNDPLKTRNRSCYIATFYNVIRRHTCTLYRRVNILA